MVILRVISLDFGSTNSQVGIRFFDKDTGKPLDAKANISSFLKTENGSASNNVNIPTAIGIWCGDPQKNPEILEGKRLIGNNLMEKKEKYGKNDLQMVFEWKSDLFYSQDCMTKEQAEKQEIAKKYTLEFFKYIHDEVVENQSNNEYVADETRVILTVPARSTTENKSMMANIAKEAGFENIDIVNDIRNEERSALDYVIFSQQSVLLKGLEESTATKSGEKHLLMIDIGGSQLISFM